VANRAVTEAEALEGHQFGVCITVDNLSPAAAATMIGQQLSWPPERRASPGV
jgi:hypothetical protein